MHRGGWSLEKTCASAIERTDELSNSSRTLRQFETPSPTSERKRQRICVQAETDMETALKQRPLAVRDKKKTNNKKTKQKRTHKKTTENQNK